MDIGTKARDLELVLINILEKKPFPEESYLAGGTALYYYLRHRLSVDLDFFTPKTFRAESLAQKMRDIFSSVTPEILEQETVIFFLTEAMIKCSLFHFRYPLLSPLVLHEVRPGIICPLASLDDIEAMKALALAQRGAAKDFIDLYHLLGKTGHSFGDLARRVQDKYRVDRRYDYRLKTAMVYFDDAERELEEIRIVGTEVRARPLAPEEWEAVKNFFVRFCR